MVRSVRMSRFQYIIITIVVVVVIIIIIIVLFLWKTGYLNLNTDSSYVKFRIVAIFVIFYL
jgi:multidrug resistance efflux pump